MRTSLLVTFFTFLSLCHLSSFAQDYAFPRTEKFIQDEVRRRGVPGASFAITIGDQIVRSGGIGVKSVESGEAVTADTLFHIGSTHKSMTAVLIAQLAEQGLLSWQTRVGEILSANEFVDFAVARITLHQLMSMTGGVGEDGDDDLYFELGDFATPEQVIEFIKEYELTVLPGREFSYSNLSASLAGYLSVYSAGKDTTRLNQSYSELLAENILTPLGMTRSTIFITEARADGDYSLPHTKSGGISQVAESEDRDDDMFAPAGSLKSSAKEMAKYLMLLAHEGVSAQGQRLLSQNSVRRLWRATKVSKKTGDNYGLGWDVKTFRGAKVLQHEGAFDNFTSVIMVVPRLKASLVILANTEYVGRLLSQAPKVFARELSQLK